VNEFEALYAYKCGLFEECIAMCQRGVGMMRDNHLQQGFLVAYPEMLSLLDGELVSVFGIIHLLRPGSFFTLTDILKFLRYHEIRMLALLLYLIVQCQKRLLTDSLHDTMKYIIHVHDKVYPANYSFNLDRLILRLIYRSTILFTEAQSKLQTC